EAVRRNRAVGGVGNDGTRGWIDPERVRSKGRVECAIEVGLEFDEAVDLSRDIGTDIGANGLAHVAAIAAGVDTVLHTEANPELHLWIELGDPFWCRCGWRFFGELHGGRRGGDNTGRRRRGCFLRFFVRSVDCGSGRIGWRLGSGRRRLFYGWWGIGRGIGRGCFGRGRLCWSRRLAPYHRRGEGEAGEKCEACNETKRSAWM